MKLIGFCEALTVSVNVLWGIAYYGMKFWDRQKVKDDWMNGEWISIHLFLGSKLLALSLNDRVNSERMNEWMNKCIYEWMNEWMNKWGNEWMNEWLYVWIGVWMGEWMD